MRSMTNKHDQRRRDAVVKTLAKAEEQLREAALYLVTNERPADEIYAVNDAHEHVLIALERLGVNVDDGERATDEEAVYYP